MLSDNSEHNIAVKSISEKIQQWSIGDKKRKLRIRHGSTNSTRANEGEYDYVDVGCLNRVLEVNAAEKWVLVEPNVPMSVLVDETLKYGLLPEVVMEFPHITVGGGIQGAALESSSFRYGQFNDTCVEYELVLGNGEVARASSSENPDIFYGISGSYGTLAVLTLAKVRLVESAPYVRVAYTPLKNHAQIVVDCLKIESTKSHDFLEGIIFSKDLAVVINAVFVSNAKTLKTFSKATDPWFYRHVKNISKKGKEHIEFVPIKDYLFRYNRGAFWMGEYVFPLFHLPRGKFMRFIMNPVLSTRKLYEYMHVVNVTQNYFIQDFYYSFNKAKDYLDFNAKEFGIYPIWLCPIKATVEDQRLSPHYSTTKDLLLNIGIYGQSKKFLKKGYVSANREVEKLGASKGARKMFYAHSYYPRDEFWELYDKKWYQDIRKKYHADDVFPDIWEKIYVSKKYNPKLFKNFLPYVLKELLNYTCKAL